MSEGYKAELPEALVVDTAVETTKIFKQLWESISEFPLDKEIVRVINGHLKTIPLST